MKRRGNLQGDAELLFVRDFGRSTAAWYPAEEVEPDHDGAAVGAPSRECRAELALPSSGLAMMRSESESLGASILERVKDKHQTSTTWKTSQHSAVVMPDSPPQQQR